MSGLIPNRRYWAVVPAAGLGIRMNADRPKQYLMLNEKTIIENTLDVLSTYRRLSGIVVAIHSEDIIFPTLSLPKHLPITTVTGGSTRLASVLNAVIALEKEAKHDDWVLVHDAVRPYLQHADIDRLCQAVQDHPVGGILALPSTDTLKRVNSDFTISETIPRETVWRAQTPQLFHYAMLREALEYALSHGIDATDESSALEHRQHKPIVVMGSPRNIKITSQDDLNYNRAGE